MSGPEPAATHSRVSRLADGCALLAAAIGLLVIAGWLLDIDALKRVQPGLVAMKFNTALGFVAAGAGLWWRKRPAARIPLGALVALLGALSLGEYLAGRSFGIDQLFLRELAGVPDGPGRMAPSSALCFLLLGGALIGSGGVRRTGLGSAGSDRGSRWPTYAAELLALIATVIGGFSLIAYATGAVYLRQLPGSIGMALHTAAAFVVLGPGILLAADGILMQTLRLRGTGRVLAVGFGVLTLLLVAVGTVFAVNLQRLAEDLDAQANVARPRREATLELENRILGHGLAVRLAITGDPQARRAASEEAVAVDRHLADYRALATSDWQRELAARFAGQWQELRALGAALLDSGASPSREEVTRLAALSVRLVDLLEDEMRPEAVESFEARKTTTLRDLRRTGYSPLLLLVASVILSVLTSGAVARAVSQHEQTVREQREWLRVTLSSIGDGVIACDTESRVTFLNPVAESLTGWRAAEAQGRQLATVLRLINEQTREPAADIAEQVLREGRVVELANHTALVTRDGREVPIEDSAAPITDDVGKLTGAVIVFHDVTQRRRAIDQVRDSAARLALSQEMAHLGSWELDPVRDHLTWSDEVYRIFGLEPQQFQATYEAFLEAVHPDDRTAVDAAYAGSVRDGREAYEIEHRVVRRSDGDVRIVHEKCLHFRDAEGRVLRSVGMVHDITARKHAEEALRESEERYRLLTENAVSAVAEHEVVLDAAGKPVDYVFLSANPSFETCTGLRVADVLGRRVTEVLPGVAKTDLIELYGRVALTGEPVTFERYFQPLERNFLISAYRVGAGHFATAFTDITERKRAEEALAAAHLLLADTDRRRTEFLAVLSHELRNPLTSVCNSLRVLERAVPGSEQAQRAQEVMDRQTRQLVRLVDDLLDVTRVTRNKIQLKRAPLDLNELVRRSVEDYRSSFEDKGVALEVELAPEPLTVDGDAARLAQVVGNLLQNAAKFTPAGGRVAVSTSAATPRGPATLRIADSGAGIDAAMLGHLFQPFMQADATLDRSNGGLGLGLALVKGLVEMHGGKVHAHSDGSGKGAAFVVELPLDATAAAEVTPAAPGAAVRHRRVLIIEDNVDAADSLGEVLRLGEHEVEVAYGGPAGLALARVFRPEVVLCDIGLPGMDGYAVARAFRADDALRGVFLVALSGYALPEDLQRAAEAGFDRHLSKPPALEKVERLLAGSLERPAAARVDASPSSA